MVLVFGNRFLLEHEEATDNIRKEFPNDHIVFGSIAGEISCCHVNDNAISVIAIEFEKNYFLVERQNILDNDKNAKTVEEVLFNEIPKEN